MKEVANIVQSVIAVRKKRGKIRENIHIRTYAQKKGGGVVQGSRGARIPRIRVGPHTNNAKST